VGIAVLQGSPASTEGGFAPFLFLFRHHIFGNFNQGMKMCAKIYRVVIFCLCSLCIISQTDTSQVKKFKIGIDSNTVFSGSDNSRAINNLILGGYVSTYYAWYSDETVKNGFVQIPAVAPRHDQFGLNMALISAKYDSKDLRGTLGVHFGDIPQAIWPAEYNMIQEANAGVRLIKGLWLDVGFFRSHVGIESTQPRENIPTSMSVTDNYEPYYFSGAKLTYVFNEKLSLQVNLFNSFNTFVDYNKNKVFGFTALYNPNEKISIAYNFLSGDESPYGAVTKRQRYYNDLFATIKLKKLTLGVEVNYGWQENSARADSTKDATMYSGLIVAKYQFVKKFAAYYRQEYFSDPDQMLTGSLAFGDYIYGGTFGLEYKPYKGIAMSLEGRALQADNLIFREKAYIVNQRYELIACLDLSF
jgi:hypothetical protein